MLAVLDSTVLIDYLRGRPAVDRVQGLRSRGDVAATTSINVEEIVRGLRETESESALRLFRGLIVLPIDEPAAWQAGTWRRQFAARGITLFPADCLIGAVAQQHRAVLCSGNPRDFPMSDLMLQHWPVGG